MELLKTLLTFVVDSEEITKCLRNVDCHFDSVIKICYDACTAEENSMDICHKFDVEMLLDFLHDELNTGHWSDVAVDVRRAFQAASFVKVLVLFKRSPNVCEEVLKEALKSIDLGLLLGAPLEINCDLLNKCASFISKEIQKFGTKDNLDNLTKKVTKGAKRKYVTVEVYDRLQGTEINVLKCPSLETFNKHHFVPRFPVKLQGEDVNIIKFSCLI